MVFFFMNCGKLFSVVAFFGNTRNSYIIGAKLLKYRIILFCLPKTASNGGSLYTWVAVAFCRRVTLAGRVSSVRVQCGVYYSLIWRFVALAVQLVCNAASESSRVGDSSPQLAPLTSSIVLSPPRSRRRRRPPPRLQAMAGRGSASPSSNGRTRLRRRRTPC